MNERITLGTLAPIFVARGNSASEVRPGQDYFLIRFGGAQAAFTGPVWERVKRLIIQSQVNLNYAPLGPQALRSIQSSREVKKDRAEQLGLARNLVDLVPAVMTHVSISVEFVLDRENRIATLANLINENSFQAAVSLAPGASLLSKTMSELAQKIVQAFVPADDQQPILQFTGDFNLVGQELREGFYVIFGSRDERHPLPDHFGDLSIENGRVLKAGSAIDDLSYVILDVRRTEARTRERSDGAAWAEKLRQAEDVALDCDNRRATEDERQHAWKQCQALLREAQALLRADPTFLTSEAQAIIKSSYHQCDQLTATTREAVRGEVIVTSGGWHGDSGADRMQLGIDVTENLNETLTHYAVQVASARRILRDAGL